MTTDDNEQLAPEGLDIEAILAMPEEEIALLPPDAQQQLYELKDQRQAEIKAAAEARQQRVLALGQRLKGEFDQRVTQRQVLEQRWIADTRRYNGQYDPETLKALQNRKYGSTIFVPLTRRVCNLVEARLGDLLYPTEDRNYSIDATPVPELAEAEMLAARMKPDSTLDLPGMPSTGSPQGVPRDSGGTRIAANDIRMAVSELREEAKKKAAAMLREVDDQLRQANFGSVGREVIHDGIVLGTGVMKGPMVLNRIKKSWTVVDGIGSLKMVEDLSPTAVRVNPWDFYPDMSARKMSECGSVFERHYLNKAEFARLAKQPGFDPEAIRIVLQVAPGKINDTNREAMRESSGMQGVQDVRYELLEYHGPIDVEDLEACGCLIPDDPLVTYEGVVFLTPDGIVVKAIINPMATEERPYSVWNWQKDQGSIFGFGLPYECADLQDVGNSSFRAAMDNLGLSVGPQIVLNSKVMKPHDGNWTITPNKIWEIIERGVDAREAFAFFQIDSKISELLNVFNGAKALLDEIAGPQLAMQGQENTLNPRTDFQASIAHNASNIWMRRAVRHWDDDITSTLVQRFVDWNMQHNPKAEIKGDLLVMARGTSALLEAEGQVQRIGFFMQMAKDIPMPFKRKVAQLREMAKAMRLDASDVLPDEAEIERIAAQVDNQQAPPNPELERIKLRQAEVADKVEERNWQWAVEKLRAELRTAEIASREGLTRQQAEEKYQISMASIDATLQNAREERAHKSKALNAELAMKAAVGTGV